VSDGTNDDVPNGKGNYHGEKVVELEMEET
jgi:hypothetical protein